MCGIVGVVGRTVDSVTSCLSHRGPDANDDYRTEVDGEDVYFGHSRLSIIGLSEAGNQPMRAGDVVLTYNGEIYNYRDLRSELAETYQFQSKTDSEVLLHGYREWGIEQLLNRVNGIFAFGILDENKGELVIARDHLGVKPVYYFQSETEFGFASEAKALFEAGLTEPQLRADVLPEFLANRWVHEPRTLFQSVQKLPAGSYLTLDIGSGEVDVTDYWDIWHSQTSKRTKISELLPSVVEEQMVSDVPVGSYLSGGIDSTLVTYYAAKNNPGLTALNLNNSTDREYDEHANVGRLQNNVDIELDVFDPDEDMIDIYKKMIYYLDEPIADPAVIPAHFLARRARHNGIKVMLSGMAGDELFGGYRRVKIVRYRKLLQWGWPAAAAARVVFSATNTFLVINRVAEFIKNPIPERYHLLTAHLKRSEISQLVEDDEWAAEYDKRISSLVPEEVPDAKKFQYLDWRGFLASHNLMYVDKASMAAGVEVRVPIADRRIAEQWFDLPLAEQQRNGMKTPLRGLLKSELGKEYIRHNKQGFTFPINKALKSEVVQADLDIMMRNDQLGRAVNQNYVSEIVDRWQKRPTFYSGMKVWTLYTLYLWLNEFDVSVRKNSVVSAV